MDLARSTMRASSGSHSLSSTIRREPATQLWPLAPKMPAMTPLAVLSRSASAKAMIGDLPPSSSVTWAKLSAVLRMTWRAVSGPPVKATRATSGWDVSALPQGSPRPVMTLTTPGGMPACSISSANSSSEAGPCSDALITTALPAASAGPSFSAVRNSWEFQGTMAATTPIGSRTVITSMSGLSIGRVAPSILSARPAK